ncbi:MAG: Crp/Fnr family transcriptional regulator [Saprospiraceae bacterium]|nr:Crp/Fnr family transcriptional regulator [Saprospiraceae bacterium]
MQEQSLWYLENIDVTGVFCPKKLDMGDLHSEKVFSKGDYIYLPEDQSDKIYFLFDGQVKIGSYSDTGKEITKTILGRGEVFGILSMVGEAKRRDFAQATEKTTICVVPVEVMRTMMREHSSLNLFLMRMFGSRMLEMERRLESLVFKDSRSRIIEFIQELVAKRGQRVGYEMLVRKFLTHQEIANLTATSRQTVTTVLNELRNKNILTFNRKRLLVRDMDLLANAATET